MKIALADRVRRIDYARRQSVHFGEQAAEALRRRYAGHTRPERPIPRDLICLDRRS